MSTTKLSSTLLQPNAPSLFKLSACLLYEFLTIVALSIVFAGIFYALFGDATEGLKRLCQQVFLWGVIAVYYLWCWTKSGQTLAMQAWHLKVINQDGSLLSMRVAVVRYLLANLSLLLFGLGFLSAVVDRKRLFLHDRCLKTKVVLI